MDIGKKKKRVTNPKRIVTPLRIEIPKKVPKEMPKEVPVPVVPDKKEGEK